MTTSSMKMPDRPDGGPAFPAEYRYDGLPWVHPGMSLRDWLAAQALPGMIATAAAPCLTGVEGVEPLLAAAAYRIADAMLAERSK